MRWAALTLALVAPAPLPALAQLDSTAEIEKLERSWQRLDRELRALDALIPPEPEPIPNRFEPAPPLPQSLLKPNAAPTGALAPDATAAPLPLALPDAEQLQAGAIQSLSLDQALAIAFSNNPELQAQRERVAASLAELQAAMGTYWPRISAYAEGSTGQNSNNMNVPTGNDSLNGVPVMSKNGLLDSKNQPTNGPSTHPQAVGLTTTAPTTLVKRA